MGTTLTAALVAGDEVSFGHVGDSRAYLLRDGELSQLTNDHSLVEELRRQGKLTKAQAAEHPQRSVITRALGPEPDVAVDTMTVQARPGDVFLLCSDGLTTMLSDDEVHAILERASSLDEAARRLVRAANDRGGRDNITVILFRLEEVGAEAPIEGATLVGPSAEAAGLTGEKRPRGDGGRAQRPPRQADRRSERPRRARQSLAAPHLPDRRRARGRRRCCSSVPGTAAARSGSSAPTTRAAWPSTAVCRMSCPSASTSTRSATRARSR